MDLKEKVSKLPSAPGVYLMKDSQGGILYVGKSKNLKSRVQSYFYNSTNHSSKVEKLVNHLKDFDIIQTDTEFEALMLECNLIKELQPSYNRSMKNTKSSIYIKIKMDQLVPSIQLTNTIGYKLDSNQIYFGPYTSKKNVENAIEGLKDFYKINCSNANHQNTPCINYSIGLCIGVCFKRSAKLQYQQIISRFIALLKGTSTSIIKEMEEGMVKASQHVDFEKAAKLRDCIHSINTLLKRGKVVEFVKNNNTIVVCEYIDRYTIKLFLIRSNTILFNKLYNLEDQSLEVLAERITSSIVAHFTTNKLDPIVEINNNTMDKAQIIYHYLNSEESNHILVSNEWFHSKGKLLKAITTLLKTQLDGVSDLQDNP